ncbi:MAG: hypothetical protein U0271_43295 [Polyangiaceae bacterium]
MLTRPAVLLVAFIGLATHLGCSAGTDDHARGGEGGATSSSSSSTGGEGGSTGTFSGGAGGMGGTGGTPISNPCDTQCGTAELCDGVHRGVDDNCNDEVDEGCPCFAGESASCFRGDPKYLNVEGCHPGVMACTELATWGPCMGGSHATEGCYEAQTACHPITSVPFKSADLIQGLGNFGADATSYLFEVECPAGVVPCPTPNGALFQPLVSGEYTVHYTKTTASGSGECSFPLYVGDRGLRVELSWNYPAGATADLDLHMHESGSTAAWKFGTDGVGANQDCGWANCRADDFLCGGGPKWFQDGNTAPDPVNWWEEFPADANTCYFAPRGEGDKWRDGVPGCPGMQGCHNPRLDVDNFGCSPGVLDVANPSFCAPENINIDYPPASTWTRVAVHYFLANSTFTGPVTPTVKIWCDAELAAELGPAGYSAPVTLTGPQSYDKVWHVADVAMVDDECGRRCVVRPLHLSGGEDPIITSRAQAELGFTPDYLPAP